jgi:hypothetical protein
MASGYLLTGKNSKADGPDEYQQAERLLRDKKKPFRARAGNPKNGSGVIGPKCAFSNTNP